MLWSADDQLKFALQVLEILQEGEAATATQRLVSLIEDVFLLYNVPTDSVPVPAKLQEIFGLMHRPALQREMERRSLSWSEFLARMIAIWVSNMVNLHNVP
jgi:hypothetical protein